MPPDCDLAHTSVTAKIQYVTSINISVKALKLHCDKILTAQRRKYACMFEMKNTNIFKKKS